MAVFGRRKGRQLLQTILAMHILASANPLQAGAPITARVVTADQRSSCKYLGLVTATASAMGRDKPGRALEHALRKAQDMGGDGLFLINQTQNAFDGASVSGEALLCAAGATAKP